MVSLASLWLPILLSAVAVFVASSIIHMALDYHRQDFQSVPNEAAALDALRALNLPPGDYALPRPASMAELKDPAFIERMTRGPVVIMTVAPSGVMQMGGLLTRWFVFGIVVALFAAYVASSTLQSGTPYLAVFRVTGTVSFVCYGMALWHVSIWYHKAVSTTVRYNLDALIYALLTAGLFGWLWPR